jgi:hypothetical protein
MLDQPLFTLWVAGDDSSSAAGELTFGSINSKYFSGPLNQIPVNSKVRPAPALGLCPMHLSWKPLPRALPSALDVHTPCPGHCPVRPLCTCSPEHLCSSAATQQHVLGTG